MATIPASENEFPHVTFAESAAPSTPASGLGLLYFKSDGKLYSKNDAGTEVEYGAANTAAADLAAHLADTGDAHDASAISVLDSGNHFTATDVEAALAELFAAIGAGGISPTIVAAKGDILGASANDTPAITSVGANGSELRADSAQSTGLRWASRAYQIDYYTSGNIALTSTSKAALSGPSDLVVAAAAGDVVMLGLSVVPNSNTAASVSFDYATMVGGSPVNYLSNLTGTPITAGTPWIIGSGETSAQIGAVPYVVQSGDISGGNVTFRSYYRVSANRTINASSTCPLIRWAQNMGH